MTPLIFAASTSIGGASASFLPVLNEYLRAGSAVVGIIAGIVTIAVGLKKLRARKTKSED